MRILSAVVITIWVAVKVANLQAKHLILSPFTKTLPIAADDFNSSRSEESSSTRHNRSPVASQTLTEDSMLSNNTFGKTGTEHTSTYGNNTTYRNKIFPTKDASRSLGSFGLAGSKLRGKVHKSYQRKQYVLCACENTKCYFSNCDFTSVPQNLSLNIIYLDLSKNEITALKQNGFSQYTQLENLDLSYNKLSFLEKGAFNNLSRLTDLNLTENEIGTQRGISEDIFKPLTSLRVLRLSGNDFPCYSHPPYMDMILSPLQTVEDLYIDNHGDQEYGPGFRNMTSLRNLTISCRCVMDQLTNTSFQNLRQVRVLRMGECGILGTAIDFGAFSLLTQLTVLDISNNQHIGMENLHAILWGLQNSSLHTLIMDKIVLEYSKNLVTYSTVQYLPSTLTTLFTRYNNIVSIDDEAVKGLPKNLKFVDLSQNYIIVDPEDISLFAMEGLETLLINSNSEACTTAPEERYSQFVPGGIQLYRPEIKYNSGTSDTREGEGQLKSGEGKLKSDTDTQDARVGEGQLKLKPGTRIQNMRAGNGKLKSDTATQDIGVGNSQLKLDTGTRSRKVREGQLNSDKDTPHDTRMAEDQVKSNIATQYIGVGDGQLKSGTRIHDKKVGKLQQALKSELPWNLKHVRISLQTMPNDFLQSINPVNRIEYLDLQCSQLPEVDFYYFENLPRLKYLNIGRSLVKRLYFLGIPSNSPLEVLILESNQLNDYLNYLDAPFLYLTNLVYIDLSLNQISSLQTGLFYGLDNLEYVKLDGNTFSSFNANISNMEHLKLLSLSNTALLSLPSHVRLHIDHLCQTKPGQITVDMSGCPVQCDCFNLDFLKWMVKSPAFDQNFTGYQCQYSDTSVKKITDGYEETIRNLDRVCAQNYPVFLTILAATLVLLCAVTGAIVYRFRWKIRYLYYAAYLKVMDTNRKQNHKFHYDVFVSFDSQDWQYVIRCLSPELEARGLKLLIHSRDFLAGTYIASNIVMAVAESRKTLVVLTRNLLESTWCNYELQMATMEAVHTGRQVLMFLLKENIPNQELDLELLRHIKNNTYIPYPGPEDEADEEAMGRFYDKLTHDLRC